MKTNLLTTKTCKLLTVLGIVLCLFSLKGYGQTTVTFKPGAAVGEDATIMMFDNGCIPTGGTSTPANNNSPVGVEMGAADWTWNSIGCPGGTIRNLIRFSQLSSIPSSAIILNAELKLYGVANSASYGQGNTSYAGAPYATTNPTWLRRVTSTWAENTVTWNTMPTATTAGQISIPTTTTRWNWNYTTSSNVTSAADITAMVQGWVSNPTSNFGLMYLLQTEVNYRCGIFASSDHTNTASWPELIVTYVVCDANFTYCGSSANPSTYSFTAVTTGTYNWTLNGSSISSANSFAISLLPGNHTICLEKVDKWGNKCKKCVSICVGRNNTISEQQEASVEIEEQKASGVNQEKMIPGDMILFEEKNKDVLVYPNPAKEAWTVSFVSDLKGKATIAVYDYYGQLVKSIQVTASKGSNTFDFDCFDIPKGTYVMKIEMNEQQIGLTKAMRE